MRGEVGLACLHVRGWPILPAAPKLLPVYLLGVHKHQGFTGVEDREHGESPKSCWKFRHRTHGSDRRDGTGLTGLISMYVFGMTHTPVGEGGERVREVMGDFSVKKVLEAASIGCDVCC